MKRVAIVGAGCTKFGERLDAGLSELFTEAYIEALHGVDKGIDPSEIQEAFIGSMGSGGGQIANTAPLMIDYAGIPGIPATKVENACASGGYAIRSALLSILTGQCKVALVGGVEKMRDIPSERGRAWLGVGGDTEWERWHGLTFPAVFALMATRHMHEYGTTREQLAKVAVKNHKNGSKNPKAHFQNEIKLENALKAPMVAYPLSLMDCCPTSDGASAAILCEESLARRYTDTPVYIAGFGAATDRLASFSRESLTKGIATVNASSQAYKMAGIGPDDIDLAEVHDCFTIAEIVHTEDLGFCKKGEGGKFVEEGQTEIAGKVAVNPSGGLKAKGHPIGATGVGQVYEIFKQLRNEADKPSRQVPDAQIGLAHIMGGFIAAGTVHILAR